MSLRIEETCFVAVKRNEGDLHEICTDFSGTFLSKESKLSLFFFLRKERNNKTEVYLFFSKDTQEGSNRN